MAVIDGTAGNDTLTGTSANDTINGLDGNDILNGAAGNDTMNGGAGDDTFTVDSSSDVVIGGDGTDTIVSTVSIFSLGSAPDVERLILTGPDAWLGFGRNDADDYLRGNDTIESQIVGGSGNDTLESGGMATAFQGGTGDDVYIIHNAGDDITEQQNSGYDIAYTDISYVGRGVEKLVLTGTGDIDGGINLMDGGVTIIGNTGANVLTGYVYDDTLDGGDGADTLYGDSGADTFLFHAATAYHNVDVIGDFSTGQGDKIDIHELLGAYNPGTMALTDFVRIIDSGGDSILSVDRDGAGSAYGFVQVAKIAGVTGLTDEAALAAAGNLIVSGAPGPNQAPTDISLTNASVAENAPGAVVGALTVVDPDGGSHTFSVDDSRFEVVSDQLKLRDGQSLDYETAHSVTVNITATDAGGLSYTEGFVIAVNDVPEPPLFTSANDTVDMNALQSGAYATASLHDALAGNDIVSLPDAEHAALIGYSASAVFHGGAGNDTITGRGLDDIMDGGAGNDTLNGGNGNDALNGGDGNDTLNGGGGNDTMNGGAGNDIYIVDDAGDAVNETAGAGTDMVQSGVDFTLGDNLENLTLTGSGDIGGTGNALANIITGNDGDNVLDGAGGVDRLSGGNGDDIYIVDLLGVGSSRVDLQACKLEYSIVSPK